MAQMPGHSEAELRWAAENNDGDELANGVDECPDDVGPKENNGCPLNASFDPGDVMSRAPDPPSAPERAPVGAPADPLSPAEEILPTDPCFGWETKKREDCDADGVLNGLDDCVKDPEDKDGFQDNDGCPDADNDKDGFPDDRDGCPNEAEVFNGFQDDDGCADVNLRRPSEVVLCNGRIVPKQKIHFDFKKYAIRAEAVPALLGVAEVMKKYPDMYVEVQGHADKQCAPGYCESVNNPLSKRRAGSARAFLLGQGIAALRLDLKGYGSHRLLLLGDTDAAHQANRRTEFKVTKGGPKRELAIVCGASIGVEYGVSRDEPAPPVESTPAPKLEVGQAADCPDKTRCTAGCSWYGYPGEERVYTCDGERGEPGVAGADGDSAGLSAADVTEMRGLAPKAIERASEGINPLHFLFSSAFTSDRKALHGSLGAGVHWDFDSPHYITIDGLVGVGPSAGAGGRSDSLTIGSVWTGLSASFLVDRTWGPVAELIVNQGSPKFNGVLMMMPAVGLVARRKFRDELAVQGGAYLAAADFMNDAGYEFTYLVIRASLVWDPFD